MLEGIARNLWLRGCKSGILKIELLLWIHYIGNIQARCFVRGMVQRQSWN